MGGQDEGNEQQGQPKGEGLVEGVQSKVARWSAQLDEEALIAHRIGDAAHGFETITDGLSFGKQS